jgi:hypothetical protein
MWIFTRDSFVSISEHPEESRLLQIRARIDGDIERLFPEAQVVETPDEDYRFRTAISRDRVAQAIALRIGHIDYQSISGSIEDAERWGVYVQVLTAMQEEQQRRLDRNLELERKIPNFDLDFNSP